MAQTANTGDARPTYEMIRLGVAQRYAEARAEHAKAKAAGDVEGVLYWLTRREALLDVLLILAGPGPEPGAAFSEDRPRPDQRRSVRQAGGRPGIAEFEQELRWD